MNNFIIYGCIGGLLPDAMRIIKGKYEEMPNYFRKFFFYFGLALQVALGGFVVYLSTPESLMQAMLIGYAAPNILTTLASKAESSDSNKGAKPLSRDFNLFGWWK